VNNKNDNSLIFYNKTPGYTVGGKLGGWVPDPPVRGRDGDPPPAPPLGPTTGPATSPASGPAITSMGI